MTDSPIPVSIVTLKALSEHDLLNGQPPCDGGDGDAA
jgi:hypothetical protein